MKRFALAAAVALLIVPQAFAGPWIKSLTVAQKKAKDSKQLIFVDLFADWCGWCHRMEQEVFPSATFQNATDNMVLLRLNTEDGGEGSMFARKFSITSLPTFLMLAPDGTLAGVIKGYAAAPEFVKSIKGMETKYNDFRDRVAKEPTFGKDYQKRLDLAVEFGERQDFDASETRLRRLLADPKVPADVRDKAYYNLAVTQVTQGKKSESLKTIDKLSTITSKGESLERARFLASQIYYEQGDLKAAVGELKRFKTTFPDSVLMRNVDYLLPQIEAQLKAK
ncbi:MAG: thiol disulfide interchange protein DsbD like protein [Acidobacteria bacterium]|nr:thiol disulfide interchange protein DsbD like protein [Acidobacteriota bacterium]